MPIIKELRAFYLPDSAKLGDLANKEKSALDLKLADTDFYQGNQDEVAEALKRHGELSSKIDELEGRWLEISEELQNISSSSDLS